MFLCCGEEEVEFWGGNLGLFEMSDSSGGILLLKMKEPILKMKNPKLKTIR